jgi:hypothetical protein
MQLRLRTLATRAVTSPLAIGKCEFRFILDEMQHAKALKRTSLAKRFRGLSDAGLRTCGTFI